MAETFNPYYTFLGLDEELTSPSYYQLLRLKDHESDPDKIHVVLGGDPAFAFAGQPRGYFLQQAGGAKHRGAARLIQHASRRSAREVPSHDDGAKLVGITGHRRRTDFSPFASRRERAEARSTFSVAAQKTRLFL